MESIFQDSDRRPNTNDINEMKYLDCVVREVLRLYPSSPFIGRTLAEDTKFGKQCFIYIDALYLFSSI